MAAYYTMMIREEEGQNAGKWFPQFGDYDRSVVKTEEDAYWDSYTTKTPRKERIPRKEYIRVIKTNSARQSEINKAIETLNDGWHDKWLSVMEKLVG